MTNTRLRYFAAALCALVLLICADSARAIEWPLPPQLAELQERAERTDELERENKTLRSRLRRARHANRMHARWVRKLQAANRKSVEIGPYGVAHGFLCIQTFEGPWGSNTNPIYDGGLQMDLSFQRTYGGEFLRAIGPAWLWPPFVQVAVGMRAYYSGRGYHPWPNTARKCGLL